MLNAKNRLKKRKEFGYIYKHGTKVYGQHLCVFFVSSKIQTPRIGISVGNKVGKAVVRNKLKRQIRHIMREYVPKIKNINLIILVYPEIITQDYQTLRQNIFKTLQKAKVINE
ncbi:MAG: ribonuclease P protein component [Clostridia bacterium]|nr:ribonuclease P protein component [Clostridia bacterium]